MENTPCNRREHKHGNCEASSLNTPMRALTLIYHEDLEPAINGIIARQMVVARYTKIRDVVGARTDVMQDADYEPHGKNHMLIMVAECEVIVSLAHDFQDLRRQHGHGLRGYITPVEEII